MLKRTLSLLLLASILLCGCAKKQDLQTLKTEVENIDKRVGALEALCKEMNTNISSLQTLVEAIGNQDYITATEPIKQGEQTIGYTISFKYSSSINIYNGTNGAAPVISVKQHTDGLYYWTLDGEWLLDGSGKKLPVSGNDGTSGTTPQLKIEEGNWYVSYNDGSTWTLAGPASGSDGDSFFQGVEVSEDSVTFTLNGGSSFSLPKYSPLHIYFTYVTDEQTNISAGQKISIPYTLSGSEADKAIVTASSDGNYKVSVDTEAKTINVLCPSEYTNGYINVMVYDGKGYALVRVINFYERSLSFASGLEYSVAVSGGELTVPMSLNFDYTLRIQTSDGQNWIRLVPPSKAEMKNESLVFSLDANNNETVRKATVSVIPNNGTEPYAQIVINQASAAFSIDKTKAVFASQGGSAVANIVSSRGLKVTIAGDCTWLSSNISGEGNNYALTLTAAQNLTIEPRSTVVNLHSSDGSKKLAEMEIVQAASGSDNPNALIITVQPLFANDFKVYLPINSGAQVDCYVDWGDGTVERYQLDHDNNKVFHSYDSPEAGTTYDVKITGYVPQLYSTAQKEYLRSIIAVKQWGNVGLKSMSSAFKNNKDLVSIPADTAAGFENVTTFLQAFYGCDALTTVPAGLFKYAVNATNFNQAFNLCPNLSSLPARLFENCAKAQEFKQTFDNCTSLVTIPNELFVNCALATNFTKVFYQCTALATIGTDLFKGCVSAQIFESAFSGCTSLTAVPASLFATCSAATSFKDVFNGNTALTTVPATLFADCVNVTSYQGVFYTCKALVNVPAELFSNSPEVTNFSNTFARCSELTSIPVSIFDNNKKVLDFSYTFDDCGKLAGESPYTMVEGVKYHVPERKLKPDTFRTPTRTEYYMYGTKFTDKDAY